MRNASAAKKEGNGSKTKIETRAEDLPPFGLLLVPCRGSSGFCVLVLSDPSALYYSFTDL